MPLSKIEQSSVNSGVAGTGPAFRVYLSANQSITTGVATKVAFDTEVFDTASCFDISTYRFTPNVAGYYQFNSVIGASNGSGLNYNFIEIYKNGVPDSIAIYGAYGASFTQNYGNISSLIYMNGSTDYVEMYVIISGTAGTSTVVGGQTYYSIFSGSLVRAA